MGRPQTLAVDSETWTVQQPTRASMAQGISFPGGLGTLFSYDAAGRPTTSALLENGSEVQSTATQATFQNRSAELVR